MRRLPVILFGLIGCAILIELGVWQVKRLAWKEALLAGIEAGIGADPVPLPAQVDPSMKYLPVTVSGRTDGRELLVLSGTKAQGGGYLVVSALDTEDGRRILVDRGFVPQEARHAPRPPVALQVRGNLHWPSEAGSSTPAPNLAENIWFARDVPAMAAALGTQPVLVVANAVAGDAQGVEPLPIAVAGIPNNHLGYAVTWFLLAAAWAGMTVFWLSRIQRGTD